MQQAAQQAEVGVESKQQHETNQGQKQQAEPGPAQQEEAGPEQQNGITGNKRGAATAGDMNDGDSEGEPLGRTMHASGRKGKGKANLHAPSTRAVARGPGGGLGGGGSSAETGGATGGGGSSSSNNRGAAAAKESGEGDSRARTRSLSGIKGKGRAKAAKVGHSASAGAAARGRGAGGSGAGTGTEEVHPEASSPRARFVLGGGLTDRFDRETIQFHPYSMVGQGMPRLYSSGSVSVGREVPERVQCLN